MSDKPLGQTAYFNYDPDDIQDVSDAVTLFEWLAETNADKGNAISASAYRDCAAFLKRELVKPE